jgi:uroporphyrin-III C-methyltransferase / precorrin-2 dehydrogenase / sirohydrochlorin ferrochelatase
MPREKETASGLGPDRASGLGPRASGEQSAALYPVFLKLDGQNVVIVGGGVVAEGKLAGLLAAGARVTVIAPAVSAGIRHSGAEIIQRAFEPSDLDGARWVVAAAPPEVNRAVAEAAEIRGLFVNAVDDTSSASAYLGGVIRRGEVTVAISTNGIAPALAGLLREALDAILPVDLERWIEIARRTRLEWKRTEVPMSQRRPLLLRALQNLYASESSPEARGARPEARSGPKPETPGGPEARP